MHKYSFNNLKFTLKPLKRSYMFRQYDHAQGAHIVPCYSYSLKTFNDDENHRVFLNYNFSKEQCVLPEDDSIVGTCRSVLRVLM